MPVVTGIQWCDSTGNLQMGCEGCELSSKIKGDEATCYAESLTKRWAGSNAGWPEDFFKPKIFMHRLPKILSWKDLTGTERPDKPWLNGLPRIIFLNDMGDTFSSGMPKDWFAEALPAIAKSKHQFLVLTKWPKRFVEFSRRHSLPKNIWPGTSVTSDKTLFRATVLADVIGGGPKWISGEPQYGFVNYDSLKVNPDWLILGGESGPHASITNLYSIYCGIEWAKENGIACFVKQLGSKPSVTGTDKTMVTLNDSHGGDWNEWRIKNFKVREMPKLIL